MDTLREDLEYFLDEVIRPSLAEHYGSIEIVSIEDETLKVQLAGGCTGCPMQKTTLEYGIKNYILEEFAEHIKDVQLVELDPVSELTVLAQNMGLYDE